MGLRALQRRRHEASADAARQHRRKREKLVRACCTNSEPVESALRLPTFTPPSPLRARKRWECVPEASAGMVRGVPALELVLVLCILGYPVGAQLDERPGATLAAARLDAWARQRADASLHALVLHPKFGLGNRMLSAISSLALAIATDRRLFVEWEHPFAELFDSPFQSAWEWPGPQPGHAAAQKRHLDLTASSPVFSRYAKLPRVRTHAAPCQICIADQKMHVGDLARTRRSVASELACKGAHAVLGDAAVVEVSSDQYFLPLLLVHAESRARLAALLDAPGDSAAWEDGRLEGVLVQLLGQWLLRPVEQVRRAVVAFEEQHCFNPAQRANGSSATAETPGTRAREQLPRPAGAACQRCHVGVHVRVPMFEFELRQVPCSTKFLVFRVLVCNTNLVRAHARARTHTHTHTHARARTHSAILN